MALDRARLARIGTHYERYVADGRLAGFHVAVLDGEDRAYDHHFGLADREADRAVAPDTLWRLFSMTKPVTAVAAMRLYEEGAFELKDPIETWLPEFAEARVFTGGTSVKPITEPLTEPIRVWHLLTHTAGLTYGFHYAHPCDALYRAQGFEWGSPPGMDLAACCSAWAKLPLIAQPGLEWNYSVATDVLGRLLEVLTGQSLDAIFRERIFEPLGMTDTRFGEADPERLAALYTLAGREESLSKDALTTPAMLSGGGGLVGTMDDYVKFTTMLLNEGAPLLGRRTFEFMASNHLPGGADLEQVGRPLFAETTFDGVGFGLGVSVLLDPIANKVPSTPGEIGWGGAASTAFFVDTLEGVAAIFMTQLMPSSAYPIRSQLRQLVYQALR